MNTEQIAKVCHQANKAYCEAIGDFSQVPWEQTAVELKASAIDGVEYLVKNPKATPAVMHGNWVKFKKEAGWAFGETKSVEHKRHPCMVDYKDLPDEQQVKDTLFSDICATLIPLLDDNDDD